MAWDASATVIINAVSVTTGTYSTAVTKASEETHHVTIDADFPATPTDDLVYELYGRCDGTNWDDSPMITGVIDNGTDPNQISVVVGTGIVEWRLYVYRSGSTDTITVTAKHKGDQS